MSYGWGRGTIALAAAALLGLGLGACASDDVTATADTSSSRITLEGTTWVLGEGSDLGAPLGDVVVSARFEDGKVTGQSGCNSYNGSYELDGQNLTIGPDLASTQMACGDAETAVETAYLARLPKVASYSIEGETLTLADGDDKALLEYEASVGAQAILGSWTVTSYYSGNAITSVLADATLTAEFTENRVNGNAGCNTFMGPTAVEGETIKIGPLASTRKACESEELSKQETDYLAALELATSFAVTGDRLDLFRDGGTIAATFEKA